jgi:hypothetical protein
MSDKLIIKRSLTTKNVFDKRTFRRVEFQNPVLAQAIGPAEARGVWLVYGAEKNGKTWFVLTMAKDLAATEVKKIAYVSAEEGTDDSFQEAMDRAGITIDTRILWDEYLTIDEIVEKFSRPRTPDIIFIDNLMIYKDELNSLNIKKRLTDKLPNKLFVFVAHEDRKKPYPGAAQQAKRLAKVYINVVGLKAFAVSRFATQGGEIVINDDLSEMYWGASTSSATEI